MDIYIYNPPRPPPQKKKNGVILLVYPLTGSISPTLWGLTHSTINPRSDWCRGSPAIASQGTAGWEPAVVTLAQRPPRCSSSVPHQAPGLGGKWGPGCPVEKPWGTWSSWWCFHIYVSWGKDIWQVNMDVYLSSYPCIHLPVFNKKKLQRLGVSQGFRLGGIEYKGNGVGEITSKQNITELILGFPLSSTVSQFLLVMFQLVVAYIPLRSL